MALFLFFFVALLEPHTVVSQWPATDCGGDGFAGAVADAEVAVASLLPACMRVVRGQEAALTGTSS